MAMETRSQTLRLAAVAVEFFSTILGLLIVGYLLDTELHTTPIFGVAGLLGGLALGVYRLIVGLRQLDKSS